MTVARALITLYQTLPPQEQREVAMWIKTHETNPKEEQQERKDFLSLSNFGLNGAYSDNEPEYTIDDCISVNPNFKP